MVGATKESGVKIRCMERAFTNGLTEGDTKALIDKVRSMGMVSISGLTVGVSKANGPTVCVRGVGS